MNVVKKSDKPDNSDINESLRQVVRLTEPRYKKEFEGRTAEFGIFDDLPIVTGFSWGSESGTMSFKWKGEEREEDIRSRVKGFLDSVGINDPPAFHMLGILDGVQDQFQRLDTSKLEEGIDETTTKANFTFTYDPNVAILIRPADCPISIIYGKSKKGRDLVGLIHSSAVSVNAGIPRLAIAHLINQEDLDLETLRIGISPGISRENFSISDENIINKINFPIVERNWKEYIDPKKSDSDEERRRVDVLGATLMQYLEMGVIPSQIEAYEIDTFKAHKESVGFSHRLYEIKKGSEDEVSAGRYMVAVKLKN